MLQRKNINMPEQKDIYDEYQNLLDDIEFTQSELGEMNKSQEKRNKKIQAVSAVTEGIKDEEDRNSAMEMALSNPQAYGLALANGYEQKVKKAQQFNLEDILRSEKVEQSKLVESLHYLPPLKREDSKYDEARIYNTALYYRKPLEQAVKGDDKENAQKITQAIHSFIAHYMLSNRYVDTSHEPTVNFLKALVQVMSEEDVLRQYERLVQKSMKYVSNEKNKDLIRNYLIEIYKEEPEKTRPVFDAVFRRKNKKSEALEESTAA